jgi:hypothetical protein
LLYFLYQRNFYHPDFVNWLCIFCFIKHLLLYLIYG